MFYIWQNVTASAETPLITTSAENKKDTKIIRSHENKMILLTFFFEARKLCETIRSWRYDAALDSHFRIFEKAQFSHYEIKQNADMIQKDSERRICDAISLRKWKTNVFSHNEKNRLFFHVKMNAKTKSSNIKNL